MEASPGASAAVRNGGVSLSPVASSSSLQHSRKEWRAVPEQSIRNSSNEELESSKLVQSDERLIYEVHGREALDVDFCSRAIDGSLDNDILQQRLQSMAKEREELQNLEIELRAQVVARSVIVRLQNAFDTEIKEHANVTVKLQEQNHEKEQKIHELERSMNEKERELHAIRLDNESAWAKEDLLREQNKELQSYRRERDNSEAERAEHMKQIHDLQEHIQEKERQFIELQEQHRIAQENILYKDEQIREAQAWITRAQEIDAMHTANIHTLQAELLERTEQCHQLWLGCQRQIGEMERLHLHAQQLQREMADLREKSGSHSEGSHVPVTNSNDASLLEHFNGNQLEVSVHSPPIANTGSLQNSNSETSMGSTLPQTDHAHGVPFAPSSLFGIPAYLPTTLHPFAMHQQGVLPPVHVTQSPLQSLSAISSIENMQSQQVRSDDKYEPNYNHNPEETEENLLPTAGHYNYGTSVNGQVHHVNYVDTNVSARLDNDFVVPPANGEKQVHGPIDESHENSQSQLNSQRLSSHFHEALRMDSLRTRNDTEIDAHIKLILPKEMKGNLVSDHGPEDQITMMGHSGFANSPSSSKAPNHAVHVSETTPKTSSGDGSTNAFVSIEQIPNIVEKPVESYLLDERALLASIARTIGSSGRIRISSTLPNRLGKMLAPLHWHDYKKMYGKLDDFVASHSDLFLIEGDYIQLREGAQKTIAASAALAKVAAAAVAPSSFSLMMPSVAVTPMAQSHQLKKLSVMQSQNLNDGTFHVSDGVSSVRILSKSKDLMGRNGSVTMPGVRNGTIPERNDFSQSKVASHGRPGVSLVGQTQSRTTGTASSPRR